MKNLLKLSALLLVLTLLAGCNRTDSMLATALVETPVDVAGTTESDGDYTVMLQKDASYQYKHTIEEDETLYIRELFRTNTTSIQIANSSDLTITCNLYYPDDTTDVILTHTLAPGQTAKFTGLTSVLTYCIGFQSEESGTIDVTVYG